MCLPSECVTSFAEQLPHHPFKTRLLENTSCHGIHRQNLLENKQEVSLRSSIFLNRCFSLQAVLFMDGSKDDGLHLRIIVLTIQM